MSIEPYPTPNIQRQNLQELLKTINFVDRIIFGRMNYSKAVSEYKGYKHFFHEKALEVIDFCRRESIQFHIKEGTMMDQCE